MDLVSKLCLKVLDLRQVALALPITKKILPFDPILIDSPRFLDPPLDLCSSHRFFVTPGPSNSLVEEARSGLAATSKNMGSTSTSMSTCCDNLNDDASATVASNDIKQVRLLDDCIAAALTDSPSPYDDFRESMQEMVEEKLQNNGKVEWDLIHGRTFVLLLDSVCLLESSFFLESEF